MLQQCWTMTQLILLFASVAVGTHLPHAAIAVSIVLLLGAVVILPAARRPLSAWVRLWSPTVPGPPARPSYALEGRDFVTAGDPGAPGTALARAPGRGVHAFA